jgi:hypothetical protein
MPNTASNVLSLDQSYQAAFLWFDHKGEPPDEITEPAHGSVQLITETTFARVRWSDKPVEQTSVLALLKAAPEDKRLVIFSASGFTTGAISVAESQGIALYSFDSTGIAHPKTTRARSLAPSESQDPPFPPPRVDTEDEEDFWAQTRSDDTETVEATAPEHVAPLEANPDDWTDCPSCGTTHFRTAGFCRSCGAHLETGDPHPHNATAAQLGLRCRTCDGTDIAIGITPTDAA